MKIVLIGMPGAGKTTIGKIIAEKIHHRFFDTDDIIQSITKKTISELYMGFGESFFREAESKAVQTLKTILGGVVATGGGVVLSEQNMAAFESYTKIWIDTAPINIEGRIVNQNRPSLGTGKEVLKNLLQKDRERARLYQKYADYKVSNNGKIDNTIEEISRILKV